MPRYTRAGHGRVGMIGLEYTPYNLRKALFTRRQAGPVAISYVMHFFL